MFIKAQADEVEETTTYWVGKPLLNDNYLEINFKRIDKKYQNQLQDLRSLLFKSLNEEKRSRDKDDITLNGENMTKMEEGEHVANAGCWSAHKSSPGSLCK